MTHLSTGHDVPVAIFCGFRPFLEDLRYGGTADEVAKVADATQNHLLEHGRLADIRRYTKVAFKVGLVAKK